MIPVWICDYHQGERTYHDTETQAEAKARDLVASQRTTRAVVYRIDINEEHQ